MSNLSKTIDDKLAEPIEKIDPVEYELYNDEKRRILKECNRLDSISSSWFSDIETRGADWSKYLKRPYLNVISHPYFVAFVTYPLLLLPSLTLPQSSLNLAVSSSSS